MGDERKSVVCSFEGCWRRSTRPYPDGWSYLAAWGPGIKDGFYCQPHADALEALNISGELDHIQGAR